MKTTEIPQYIIEAARAVPIPEVWKALGLPAPPRPNAQVCSPFREDHNPTVQIGGKLNIVTDYGTGDKWDTIALVMEVKKCTFPEAVSYLTGESLHRERTTRPKAQRSNGAAKKSYTSWGDPIATFVYQDETGQPLFRKQRFPNNPDTGKKRFSIARREGNRWIKDLAPETRRILYRLPQVIKAVATGETVHVAEGEKDVHSLEAVGCCATTNFDGAQGGWLDSYSDSLRGAHIVIHADNDKAGEDHVAKVFDSLRTVAASVKIVRYADPDLPPKADVSDFLAAHSMEDLLARIDSTPFEDLNGEPATGGQPEAAAKHQKDGQARQDGQRQRPQLEIYPPISRPTAVLNDAVTAERMYQAVGDSVLYCEAMQRFFSWTGKIWEHDQTRQAHRYAKEAAQSFYEDAARARKAGKSKEAKSLEFHARKSETHRGIIDILGSFRTLPGVCILAEDLDAQPIINFENGRFDLETFQFRSGHRPEDRLTKIIRWNYNENSECPRWMNFLQQITDGDTDRITYLQRLAGYSLTPFVSEQHLWIFYGTGRNGKSTFLNTLKTIWGAYAAQLDTNLLLSSGKDSHPCNFAQLKGLRLGIVQEVEQGRRMAESVVKRLTGGETIEARFIHSNWFNFEPTHKILMATNHKPVIQGTDEGIWRRIKMIPFTTTIRIDQVDKDLPGKLLDEAEGILAWAMDGLLAWKESSFPAVSSIEDATGEYRRDQDVFDLFLDEICILREFAECRSSQLRRAYEEWCSQNGHRPITGKMFGSRLKERGCSNRKSHGATVWVGIGLSTNDEEQVR